MPKKFGVNSKKEEARITEKVKKQEKQRVEEERKEAEKWVDNDKQILRQQQRKQEQEDKKLQELQRKQENQKLFDEDLKQYKQKNVQAKVTKSDLEKRQQELYMRALNQKINQLNLDKDEKQNSDDEYNQEIENNINDLLKEQQLNKPIIQEQQEEEKGEKHPEKRMKAAYQKYVEDRLPELKKDYPTLRRTQLLEIIFKDWKKAPENPMNQKYVSYDTKV